MLFKKNSHPRLMVHLLFLSCVLGLLVLGGGCQPAGGSKSSVLLVDADRFPEHLAGVWRNQSHGWILMFDEDGRLSKMTHTTGRVNLRAGQAVTFPLKEGGTGQVVPGPWLVQYDGRTNELAVEVTLESFSYKIQGNVVRGSSKDIFMGEAPGPDQRVWQAQWISFPKFIATTADKSYEDYELPIEAGQEDMGVIEFEKVDLDAYR